MEKDTKVRVNKSELAKEVFEKMKEIFFSSRKRTVVSIIVILLLIFFGWKKFFGSNQPRYQTATVQKGTIIATVSDSGNVASQNQAVVDSPTTGIISDIYVRNGDTVTAGQNLFSVKSTASAQDKASAYSSYLQAQNNLNAAQATQFSLQSTMFNKWNTFFNLATNSTYQNSDGSPNNTNRVLPQFTTAQDDWLAAEATYKNQQGVVNQTQAALNTAYLAYSATQDTTVTAPLAGTVANISVQKGDEIVASTNNPLNSSSSSSTNVPVLYIGNFTSPYVKVQASETDISSIKPGQLATITLDAFPNQTFAGKVSQADSLGTNTSGVITYNVFVNFLDAPPTIKPAMSATVTIQTARKDNVLSVPNSAIQTISGQKAVRVLKNGQITLTPVKTGIASDTDTEITSGLSEGNTIITGAATSSTSGTKSSPFGGGGLRFGGGRFGGG